MKMKTSCGSDVYVRHLADRLKVGGHRGESLLFEQSAGFENPTYAMLIQTKAV